MPLPPLLKTYEEARLLLEAKGWGVAKGAEHLSEMPELARFHISQAKLSKKTTPGSKFPIEPEVAAAVQGMETRAGYERQTDIVTRGLLALHGDPPIVDVDRLAAELEERLPASELALKLLEALEEKSGQRLTRLSQKLAERSASELTPRLVEVVGQVAPKLVEAVEALEEEASQRATSLSQELAEKSATELASKVVGAVEALEEKASQRAAGFFQTLAEKLSRASWRQIAISAGSGALVGCLALLLAPLLLGSALAAPQPGPLVVLIHHPTLGDSPLGFEPESPLAPISDPGRKPWKRPAEQQVPSFTLPEQKVAPCDSGLREEAIYGNCWAQMPGEPPCGRLFRHGNKCYRPIAADPKKPVELAP